MLLRYFDSVAILGNAQLSRIRCFRSFITWRILSVKFLVIKTCFFFLFLFVFCFHDLPPFAICYTFQSRSIDWTEPKSLVHQGSHGQSSVGSGCMPHHAMANIFSLENWQRRSSKVYNEIMGKRASWVTVNVDLTNA